MWNDNQRVKSILNEATCLLLWRKLIPNAYHFLTQVISVITKNANLLHALCWLFFCCAVACKQPSWILIRKTSSRKRKKALITRTADESNSNNVNSFRALFMIAFSQRFHNFPRFTDFSFCAIGFYCCRCFLSWTLNASPFFYGSLHTAGSLNFPQKKKKKLFNALRNVLWWQFMRRVIKLWSGRRFFPFDVI